MFLFRQCLVSNVKFIMKKEVGYIPFVGWISQILLYLLLTRKLHIDKSIIHSTINCWKKLNSHSHIVLFPEGTNLTQSSLERSRAYTQANKYPHSKYVIFPHVNGFIEIIHHLCGIHKESKGNNDDDDTINNSDKITVESDNNNSDVINHPNRTTTKPDNNNEDTINDSNKMITEPDSDTTNKSNKTTTKLNQPNMMIQAVYDLTIAYSPRKVQDVIELLCESPRFVHIYCKRYPVESLPLYSDLELKEWLIKRFQVCVSIY